ncbi:MAG: hypothetical protein JWO04_3109 [Gammaproteobacteria bacterium]|nr:hypothetical protein [Gammaproteobacteria bacterium]
MGQEQLHSPNNMGHSRHVLKLIKEELATLMQVNGLRPSQPCTPSVSPPIISKSRGAFSTYGANHGAHQTLDWLLIQQEVPHA